MPQLDAHALTLPPRYLQILLELIKQHFPQAEVWAYGSRVNGDCHAASDLDLVIRFPGERDETMSDCFDFKEALMESNLPIRVDVVDWARIPEKFRQEIAQGYVVIWNAGHSLAS